MQVNQHPVEQEEVMAYLDGELPSDRAVIVAAHMEGCTECRSLAAELHDVSRQLANWSVEVPATRLPKTAMWKLGKPALWVIAFAACLLLAVLLARQMYEAPSMQLRNSMAYNSMASRSKNWNSLADGPPSLLPSPGPMRVRTSRLVLIVKEFDKTRGAIEDILKRHRGYLGQLSATAPADGSRTLNATLRVPADQLDLTSSEIKRLGQVESESQTGEEVTQQYIDLDVRLTNGRNTEQRLTAMLHERTGQMADVLAVEREIDRVRGQIEQMEAEKKALLNRVDFATLEVTLQEAAKAQLTPHSTWERLQRAAADGYTAVADGAVDLAVFLLAYGPSLLLWGGLLFLVLRFAMKYLRKVNGR